MHVVVTGAAGRIGVWVVAELRGAGHRVLGLDRKPADGVTICDLADAEATLGAMRGADAVIHLAAVPGPVLPPPTTFDPNVTTTFHVLEAVREAGIGRVVMASSIWAYGYNPPAEHRLPPRLPLTEEQIMATTNCYGLSKRLLERMGAEYAAAEGRQVVCMRFPWVGPPGRLARTGRLPDDGGLWGRAEAWSYVDARDVALACRLAVERDGLGFAVLNIGAADTKAGLPSEELVARQRPDAELLRPVPGHSALYAIDAARVLLGYEPRHSWRDE